MQRLSLFSCAATAAGAPVLVLLGPDASSLAAKATIAATLASFGCFTTGTHMGTRPRGAHSLGITVGAAGLLHWFTGPYVHRLSHDRQTDELGRDHAEHPGAACQVRACPCRSRGRQRAVTGPLRAGRRCRSASCSRPPA